jgi:hypothetical protein
MLPTMENPYSTGLQASHATSSFPTNGVDPRAIAALQGTKPWVRLCSVIGFIGAGFIFLAALAMFLGGAAVLATDSKQTMPFTGFSIVLGVVYLLMGVLYLFPSVKLWKYGSAIVQLLASGTYDDLVEALEQQRGFWKFVGVLVLVMLAIYALIFLGAIVFGAMGAMSARH